MLDTALSFSHRLLEEIVAPGDFVIDATMGNGHDTCFLAKLVGATGKVFAFDIQEQALLSTQEKLHAEKLNEQVNLYAQGHETIAQHVPLATPIKAAIFNLGYLPKSDKTVITLPETTLQAMDAILNRLQPTGRMIVVAYSGHAGGAKEQTAVEQFCQALPQETYCVLKYALINQQNTPPVLFCVERKR